MERKDIISKLDSGGYYGSRSIDAKQLLRGFKDISPKEVDNALWSLYKDDLVMINVRYKSPRISLNPKQKGKIRKELEQ